VGDNEINQQVAREQLEKAGVAVTAAWNGEEALALLGDKKFDGVLMDMQMPVMDGLTATREIRKNPLLAKLPVIAMTANVLQGDREQCLAAGMNDFIAKPIDSMQMLTTLARWIVPAQPLAPSFVKSKAAGTDELPMLPEVAVEEAVSRMSGSTDSYYSVMERFYTGQQNVIAEIRLALGNGNRGDAIRLAHTLKGLAGTLGAARLQSESAELESSIASRRDTQVERKLATVDAILVNLLAAIRRALSMRAPHSLSETVSGQPVDAAELAALSNKAIQQLKEFDSAVDDTISRIRQMANGDPVAKKALDSIARCVANYDYEKGLAELLEWAKGANIE